MRVLFVLDSECLCTNLLLFHRKFSHNNFDKELNMCPSYLKQMLQFQINHAVKRKTPPLTIKKGNH